MTLKDALFGTQLALQTVRFCSTTSQLKKAAVEERRKKSQFGADKHKRSCLLPKEYRCLPSKKRPCNGG
jgi:hypothetical protein